MTDIEGNDAWDDSFLIQEYKKSVRLVDQQIEKMELGTLVPPSPDSGGGDKINEIKKDKKRNKKKGDSVEQLWKPGDHCVAVYKDDGLEYEAKIVSIDHKYGCCVVRYLGYNNDELQYLQELKPSRGLQAQLAQEKLFVPDAVSQDDLDNCECGDNDQEEEETEEDDDEIDNLVLGASNMNSLSPEFVMPQVPSHASNSKESSKPDFLPPPPTFLTDNLSNSLAKENDALASMLMSWYMCGYQSGYYTALKQMKVEK